MHNLAVGQVAEWLVWTTLVATSGGDLHVFLPLDHRGVDGIVHRISADTYAHVQVTAHAVHTESIVMQVPASELLDDRAVIVAVNVDLGTPALGAHAIVIDAPAFRGLATRNLARTEVLYEAQTLVPPPPGSPWARWCVGVEAIGTRILPRPAAVPAVARPAGWMAARRLGYRAEMELVRRAADCDTLNVFKAFPDLEPNEYLMYETESREVLGIQVKSVTFARGAGEAHVSVYRPALRPSERTWFVIFLAEQDGTGFLPDCAVIPSTVVAEDLGGNDVDGGLPVTRRMTGRRAPWRVPLADLGARLADVTRAV